MWSKLLMKQIKLTYFSETEVYNTLIVDRNSVFKGNRQLSLYLLFQLSQSDAVWRIYVSVMQV